MYSPELGRRNALCIVQPVTCSTVLCEAVGKRSAVIMTVALWTVCPIDLEISSRVGQI